MRTYNDPMSLAKDFNLRLSKCCTRCGYLVECRLEPSVNGDESPERDYYCHRHNTPFKTSDINLYVCDEFC